MSRLQGKVALVTGAASGIGRAIAERYLREGARVAIADIKGAEDAARSLGRDAIGVQMDVTDEKQVEEGVAQVAARLSGVDVLVSNAGVQHISALVDLAFPTGVGCWPSISTARSSPPAPASAHARPGSRRRHHLYGLRALQGGVALKAPYVTAKHGSDRALQIGRQGGRGLWRPIERDLPRVRPHSVGGKANP